MLPPSSRPFPSLRTPAQTEALFDAVKLYGEGNWTSVLSDHNYHTVLDRRTAADLREMWRQCCRVAKSRDPAAVQRALRR